MQNIQSGSKIIIVTRPEFNALGSKERSYLIQHKQKKSIMTNAVWREIKCRGIVEQINHQCQKTSMLSPPTIKVIYRHVISKIGAQLSSPTLNFFKTGYRGHNTKNLMGIILNIFAQKGNRYDYRQKTHIFSPPWYIHACCTSN